MRFPIFTWAVFELCTVSMRLGRIHFSKERVYVHFIRFYSSWSFYSILFKRDHPRNLRPSSIFLARGHFYVCYLALLTLNYLRYFPQLWNRFYQFDENDRPHWNEYENQEWDWKNLAHSKFLGGTWPPVLGMIVWSWASFWKRLIALSVGLPLPFTQLFTRFWAQVENLLSEKQAGRWTISVIIIISILIQRKCLFPKN